jgi:hypothetical protein
MSQEKVEFIRETGPGWQPAVGEETMRLLESLKKLTLDEKNTVKREALEVFSKCVDPKMAKEKSSTTGLVVGYVQSGKTLSFTTVAALAHDNGYPVVVVITGTSVDLTVQSRDRLREDLYLGKGEFRPWHHLHNPTLNSGAVTEIQGVLDERNDATIAPEDRRTVLVTVMKHHLHLANLREVFERIRMDGAPILIIDDEADQAGLNNLIKEGEESVTYQKLRELREQIPRHTFLQYTATPQGPLLISLIDVLSPDFAFVLVPGDEYVGGKNFFAEPRILVRDIPSEDIGTKDRPLTEPPESLLEALRVYFLGVASAYARKDARRGNRSMMVHPSVPTVGHKQYFSWVQQVIENWKNILDQTKERPGDPDRVDLLEEFRASYDDLNRTVRDLESFDELVSLLPRAMRDTKRVEINRTPTGTTGIKWGDTYAWIIVGGKALDRGFTVEGLTVTYMPRGVGVGNADTIQQRARFFGYKKRYLNYCRVFLEPKLRDAFVRYVDHEENIRHRLIEHVEKALPMRELRRTFLLDRTLRPTRSSILDKDYIRIDTSAWTTLDVPHEAAQAVEENRRLVNEFVKSHQFEMSEGHPERTETQRHLVTRIPLRKIYDEFLTQFHVANLSDSQRFTGVLVAIDWYLLKNPDAQCTVYYMSGGKLRERGVQADGRIANLYQGEAPVYPKERRGEVYPGDKAIRGTDDVTVQIHRLDIKSGEGNGALHDVPTVAVWIDPDVAKDAFGQGSASHQPNNV